MDYSILYRVIWKPGEVFKQFKDKPRLEPYIFIGAIVILQCLKPYVGHVEEMTKAPFTLLMNLLVGFLFFLLFPIVSAIVVTLAATLLGNERPPYFPLLSAFILCALPYYIEAILVLTVGYTPVGLGSLFHSLKSISPFAFGMLATITPFFVWIIVLWWFAVKQLLSLQASKKALIVVSLALVNIILGGWISSMASPVTR
jgi:hypothetical protein